MANKTKWLSILHFIRPCDCLVRNNGSSSLFPLTSLLLAVSNRSLKVCDKERELPRLVPNERWITRPPRRDSTYKSETSLIWRSPSSSLETRQKYFQIKLPLDFARSGLHIPYRQLDSVGMVNYATSANAYVIYLHYFYPSNLLFYDY